VRTSRRPILPNSLCPLTVVTDCLDCPARQLVLLLKASDLNPGGSLIDPMARGFCGDFAKEGGRENGGLFEVDPVSFPGCVAFSISGPRNQL
jgi:hypothetical protein